MAKRIRPEKKYIKITAETFAWFRTMFSAAQAETFLQDRNMFAIGAVFGKVACGRLIFRDMGAFIEIVDIFVLDKFRRHGIGKGMVMFLLAFAYHAHVPVVSYFSEEDENGSVHAFLQDIGRFRVKEASGYFCRVSSADISIKELRDFRKNHGEDYHIRSFYGLSGMKQKAFLERRSSAGDYIVRELPRKHCLKRLSLYAADSKGRIRAACFVSLHRRLSLELSYIWAAKDGAGAAMLLLAEIAERVKSSKKKFDIYIAAAVPQTAALIDRLLPKKTIIKRYYSAIWDMERMHAGNRTSEKKNTKK